MIAIGTRVAFKRTWVRDVAGSDKGVADMRGTVVAFTVWPGVCRVAWEGDDQPTRGARLNTLVAVDDLHKEPA